MLTEAFWHETAHNKLYGLSLARSLFLFFLTWMNRNIISWCPLTSGLCPHSCIDSWSKVKPCCPEHPFDWLKVHMYSAQWPTWLRYVRVRPTEWPGHLVNFSIRHNDYIVQQKYTSRGCENGLWYWMHFPHREMINDTKILFIWCWY